ncbi:MAG TPA: EAL domain-containing protein [Micromonosporaceae bacterium]|nr:EAL domain-containing protein [Micromonosporaceae bacterium]
MHHVSWIKILVVVVIILGTVGYINLTAHGRGGAQSETGARLRDLDMLLHEESALKWTTLTDRNASVRLADELDEVRAKERVILANLDLLPEADRANLKKLVDQYHIGLDEEVAQLFVGGAEEAKLLEWRSTDSQFDRLSGTIGVLSRRSAANAASAEQTANITLIAALALSCLMIGGLLRRFDRAHRAAAGASADLLLQERRALQQSVENEATIRRLAEHDALTGLPNRVLFTERVEQAMSEGGEQTVLFVDLDDFKRINDSLGHAVGDELLVGVAERLRRSVRGSDIAARLGGDEFALLVQAGGEAMATRVAGRIIAGLREPIAAGGTQVVTNASIGIAVVGNRDANELLRNADAAMYAAKGLGKGRYAVFAPSMHETVRNRVALESDLRRALAAGELTLHYQPVVSLHDGLTVGAEALVRWEHPTDGLLWPAVFLPVAESSGLILPLGRWVLAEACRQAQEWLANRHVGPSFAISVNLSAHQLHHPEIVPEVLTALEASGLSPTALILEITESVIMHDQEAVAGRLAALRASGIRVALDDFGTGYSSLSHLQKLPVDQVKVDRSFVAAGNEICSAILALGRTLGLETVAEGIETLEQAEHIRDLGCDLAQGYWFGKPLPATVFVARLDRVSRAPAPTPVGSR